MNLIPHAGLSFEFFTPSFFNRSLMFYNIKMKYRELEEKKYKKQNIILSNSLIISY